MVTCCFYEPDLTYNLDVFLPDLAAFILYTTPTAIGLVLWKIFITNRRTPQGGLTVLRLDESADTYSPVPHPGASALVIVLNVLTGMFTFELGVLVFDAMHALS